jgi:amino acid permease
MSKEDISTSNSKDLALQVVRVYSRPFEDKDSEANEDAANIHGLKRQLKNRHAQMITIGQSFASSTTPPFTQVVMNIRWSHWHR